MSLKIEVPSTDTTTRSGVTAKNKPWTMVEQGAYAHILDADGKAAKYPVRCKITLADKAAPYPVGMYTVDPRSFVVGDFDALSIGRLVLTPAPK
jgi:hypothetical protein